MASPVISVRDLSVSYEGHQVLDRVNLDIQSDEVMVLLGGSGSGKTTLAAPHYRIGAAWLGHHPGSRCRYQQVCSLET